MALDAESSQGDGAQVSEDDESATGSRRIIHSAHPGLSGDDEPNPALSFPVEAVVARPMWLAIAWLIGGLTLVSLYTVGLVFVTDLAARVGNAAPFLLALPSDRLGTALTALLLLGSSQLARLVFRVRSHSVRDFRGQYHTWKHVANAWLLFAGFVAVGGCELTALVVDQFVQTQFWQRDKLAWIAPALMLGSAVAWGLHREMHGCRVSLLLFQAAFLTSVVSTCCELGCLKLPESVPMAIVVASLRMLSVVLLWNSMRFHARHVIYRSLEPSARRSVWWSKVSNFVRSACQTVGTRLAALTRRKQQTDAEGKPVPAAAAKSATAADSKKKKPAKAKTSAKETDDEERGDDEASRAGSPAEGDVSLSELERLTAPSAPPAAPAPRVTASASSSVQVPVAGKGTTTGAEPATRGSVGSTSTVVPTAKNEGVLASPTIERDEDEDSDDDTRRGRFSSEAVSRDMDDGDTADHDDSDGDDEDGDSGSQTDMRHLSKKQRRKLQQQQRDRNRR